MSSVRRLDVVNETYHPAYTVWELTLACDQPCAHCGSRAATAREGELTTEAALDVVAQLAAMGTREVVLIGGEAYLHPGFLDIIRALKAAGVRPSMTTGGRGIDAERAAAMAEAGLHLCSVSIDGLEAEHDAIRKTKGSFESARAALGHLKAAGVRIAANTNINRVNRGVLEPLFDVLVEAGVRAWQVQITIPLGRAADRPEMLLQPYDLLDVVPRLAKLKERALEAGVTMLPGNNLGYFGPEERLLRSPRANLDDHWAGCQAGKFVMGIESDGAVKGCPSLQTDSYVGGNLKERSIQDIWDHAPELSFTRTRTLDDLWGFCATCPFAEPCRAGCSFSAHAVLGRPGNNPYCHFRARTLAKEGKRERLVPTTPASGLPFDHGLFEIVLEEIDATEPLPTGANLVSITRRPARG